MTKRDRQRSAKKEATDAARESTLSTDRLFLRR